jgi:hypothetical protein
LSIALQAGWPFFTIRDSVRLVLTAPAVIVIKVKQYPKRYNESPDHEATPVHLPMLMAEQAPTKLANNWKRQEI